MNILFVDDMPIRYELFKTWVDTRKHTLVSTIDYGSTVRMLESAPRDFFELMFLDHDLSISDIMCTPGVNNIEKTGTDIAKYIYENCSPKHVVIHTHNNIGAARMANILKGTVKLSIVPFGPALKVFLN